MYFELGAWRGDKHVGKDLHVLRHGVCACGAFVCVRCERQVEEADKHECPDSAAPEVDPASIAMMAKICKPCPACGALIQKNEGCNFMTCSVCKDPNHFCWETGKPRYGPNGCGGGHNCHWASELSKTILFLVHVFSLLLLRLLCFWLHIFTMSDSM